MPEAVDKIDLPLLDEIALRFKNEGLIQIGLDQQRVGTILASIFMAAVKSPKAEKFNVKAALYGNPVVNFTNVGASFGINAQVSRPISAGIGVSGNLENYPGQSGKIRAVPGSVNVVTNPGGFTDSIALAAINLNDLIIQALADPHPQLFKIIREQLWIRGVVLANMGETFHQRQLWLNLQRQ